jgi:protein-disulfide isomerase
MNAALLGIQQRYPQHVAVVFKHFQRPELMARSKVSLGVECSASQGRFIEYHTAAFAFPKIQGYTNGWRSLADSAGVPDLLEFERCVRTQIHADVIMRDYEDGRRLNVAATPTTFINGQGPVRGVISLERLDSIVTAHLRGRSGSDPLASR